MQLGKTSFTNKEKPTPVAEADILIQYLEKTFYPTIKNIHYKLFKIFFDQWQKVEYFSLSGSRAAL